MKSALYFLKRTFFVVIAGNVDVIGKSVYVKNFIEEDLVNFRAKAKEVAE